MYITLDSHPDSCHRFKYAAVTLDVILGLKQGTKGSGTIVYIKPGYLCELNGLDELVDVTSLYILEDIGDLVHRLNNLIELNAKTTQFTPSVPLQQN